MTHDADAIAPAIAAIAAGGAGVEDIAAVLGVVEALERRAKEARQQVREAIAEHIRTTGRDLVIGSIRYYLGHPKETTSRDTFSTLVALLDAASGDVAVVAGCLRSQPFKLGACRELLSPERFSELFETVERETLEEGKPRKQLQSVNLEYAKQ